VEEYAHISILKALTCVDDTVLLKASIIVEMDRQARKLSCDRYGRLCFLVLLCPGNTKYFHPTTLEWLKTRMVPSKDDPTTLVSTSKKDPVVRQNELLIALKDSLINVCLRHPYKMIISYGRDVLFETILWLDEKDVKREIFQNIANLVDPGEDAYESDSDAEVNEKHTVPETVHKKTADVATESHYLNVDNVPNEMDDNGEQEEIEILGDKESEDEKVEGESEGNSSSDEDDSMEGTGETNDTLKQGDLMSDVDKNNKDVTQKQKKKRKIENPLKEKKKRVDIVKDTFGHQFLRKLIKAEPEFAPILLKKLQHKLLDYVLLDKSSGFVVLSLLECECTKIEVREQLKPYRLQIEKSELPVAKLILTNLNQSQ